jgi:putative transcriptional regulator
MEMAMTERDIGQEIIDGLHEAIDFMEGKPADVRVTRVSVPDEVIDIRAVRTGLGLTQQQFADAYGFSVHTLRKWEQGQRQPEKPTRILLMLIRDMPEVVNRYLAGFNSNTPTPSSL